MPPERSVPRVTAAALDVGHGVVVVVVVVLAVTLSLSLSVSYLRRDDGVLDGSAAASFSRTSWSSSKPLWRGFVFFPDISEKVRKRSRFPKKIERALACEDKD